MKYKSFLQQGARDKYPAASSSAEKTVTHGPAESQDTKEDNKSTAAAPATAKERVHDAPSLQATLRSALPHSLASMAANVSAGDKELSRFLARSSLTANLTAGRFQDELPLAGNESVSKPLGSLGKLLPGHSLQRHTLLLRLPPHNTDQSGTP